VEIFCKVKTADAEMICKMFMSGLYDKANNRKRRCAAGVALGVVLGCCVTKLLGIPLPVPVAAVISGATILFYLYFLCRTLFAFTDMNIWTSEGEAITFRINEDRILWLANSTTEIPLFTGSYRLTKEVRDGKQRYLCKGKASREYIAAIKKLVLKEDALKDKIYKCRSLELDIAIDEEMYPEARAILDYKLRQQ